MYRGRQFGALLHALAQFFSFARTVAGEHVARWTVVFSDLADLNIRLSDLCCHFAAWVVLKAPSKNGFL